MCFFDLLSSGAPLKRGVESCVRTMLKGSITTNLPRMCGIFSGAQVFNETKNRRVESTLVLPSFLSLPVQPLSVPTHVPHAAKRFLNITRVQAAGGVCLVFVHEFYMYRFCFATLWLSIHRTGANRQISVRISGNTRTLHTVCTGEHCQTEFPIPPALVII